MGEDREAEAELTSAHGFQRAANSRQTVRFSRCRGMMESGVTQRQETQIVQSCIQLDDFLPGFGPQVLCRADT